MFGERILARSLSVPTVEDDFGNLWQYHSRSDRHSKIGCWGVLFDVLRTCPLLANHAAAGKVVFGINHPMTDFVSGRKKTLDLVICTPRSQGVTKKKLRTFSDLVVKFDMTLFTDEQELLNQLPVLHEGPVGDVLMALESKACMTAHTKAAPRLFDELTSAAQCINGSAEGAIAVGHAIINCAPTFISSDRNKAKRSKDIVVSRDPQPESWNKALSTIRKLTVRGHATDRGYDAIGVTMLDLSNDGSDVSVAPIPPSLPPDDSLNYERMIRRLSGIYESRFQNR